MKKKLTLFFFLLAAVGVQAATYRTYIGHYIFGTTYTIYINSDTAFGEGLVGQMCYTPSGGGATAYTGFQTGLFDDVTVIGANWKVIITIPAGATSPLLELANVNQSSQQYGWTGCSIALSSVLPVELTRFNAEKSGTSVMLHWATASEKNNGKFIVERSENGSDFESIGEQKGAGTTLRPNQYYFEDKTPKEGMNYYRLQTVDRDGQSAYSPVISIGFLTIANYTYLYPNPTTGELKVVFGLGSDDSYQIEIFDFLGKRQLVQKGEGIKGENNIGIPVAVLPSGSYFVRINEQSLRFLKM